VQKTAKGLNKFINLISVILLASMAILVFGNVILRYIFNSGIMWSEEMSRFLFIWLCFLGAVGAMWDNEHLGVDMIVKKLPGLLKKIVYTISSFIILYLLWLIIDGSWKVSILNLHTPAPVTGLPMFYIYITGVVMGVFMVGIVVANIYYAWFKKGAIDILVQSKESEEEITVSEVDSKEEIIPPKDDSKIFYTDKPTIAQGGGK
jgi:TRAP-type transport system small permease protein